MTWTAPTGRVYTTQPGSRLLHPQLCAPTTALKLPIHTPAGKPEQRGQLMPKRTRTRAEYRRTRIDRERQDNIDDPDIPNRPLRPDD